MRLTDKGMLRWYTTCGNTPIGNTMPNFKFSFIGMIHRCLTVAATEKAALDMAFGPIRMRGSTESAKPPTTSKSVGLITGIARLATMMLRARLSGSFKVTPFFVAETGQPGVAPNILNASELAAVMRRVDA